ncbi:MAG: MBL fold metallo-hydrolase [Gammaproteobacteria bacterium]
MAMSRIRKFTTLFILGLYSLAALANPYYCGPKSDHFDGTYFYNPNNSQVHTFLDLIRWKFTDRQNPWPKQVPYTLDTPPQRVSDGELRVTFVGHSTLLIQTDGINILTDPIWSNDAGPTRWLGPKRKAPPGITFENLPKIDLVIISHNHYDHLDVPTLQRVWKRDRPKIIAPLGNDGIIHESDPTIKVTTLDWHESVNLNKEIVVHLEPSQHWCARSLWDKNVTLWGAYIIDTPSGKIYFAGDTGYADGKNFTHTQQKFTEFRLALLPIGSYEPEWVMDYDHLNPDEAVRAHVNLNAAYSMAIHFGTFEQGDEGYLAPEQDLHKARQKHNIPEGRFRALNIGEAWMVPQN